MGDGFWKEVGKFLGAVLKQAGIQGVLMLAIVGLLVLAMMQASKDREEARADRERQERLAQAERKDFRDALRTVTDSLLTMQGRTVAAVSTNTEVMRVNNQVIADNTRVVRRYARRNNNSPDDG